MSETADASTANSDQVSTGGHKFVLKHVFKNVSKTEEAKLYCSSLEDFFGLPWNTCIQRIKGNLGVYLRCDRQKNEKEWSIDTEYEIHVLHPNGKSVCKSGSTRYGKENAWGWHIMTWERMEKEYLVNDELIVEVRVQIIKTTEIYGESLRSFDDEECSDVTLVVNDRKFHVAKLYLATHSPYFKTMFLGGFEESKKPEIKLSGVDADDLQKYLEALYGEDAIDEMTVEGILLLADMYDTKLLVQKCGKFLLETSKKTLKKKLEMAVRYNLYDLKKKCLSEVKTIDDIRSVVPGCISQMDPSVMAVLFEKTLALK